LDDLAAERGLNLFCSFSVFNNVFCGFNEFILKLTNEKKTSNAGKRGGSEKGHDDDGDNDYLARLSCKKEMDR